MDIARIDVIAERITPKNIYYECPHCWSKYKKNGEPYKTAKRAIHVHGNDTHSSENRVISRSHHANRDGVKTFSEVNIHITDQTLKFFSE